MRESIAHRPLCATVTITVAIAVAACGQPASNAASKDTQAVAPATDTASTAGPVGTSGDTATTAPAALATAAPAGPKNPLTGEWVSKLADLRITQEGDTFTGELCGDHPPCAPVRDGRIVDRTLTATMANAMDPTQPGGTLEFTLGPDGRRMVGKLVETARKARCEANPTPNCNYEVVLAMTKDDGSDCELLGTLAADVTGAGAASVPIGGKWRAEARQLGVMLLDLTQAGTQVTGTYCQEPVRSENCRPLSTATLAGGKLGACLAYRERGQRQMLRWDLALSTDGQSLDGKLTSTEGGSPLAISFHKQP